MTRSIDIYDTLLDYEKPYAHVIKRFQDAGNNNVDDIEGVLHEVCHFRHATGSYPTRLDSLSGADIDTLLKEVFEDNVDARDMDEMTSCIVTCLAMGKLGAPEKEIQSALRAFEMNVEYPESCKKWVKNEIETNICDYVQEAFALVDWLEKQ